MENKNDLTDFTSYIESLCEKHTAVNHTEKKKHFLELGNDQQLQEGKKLYYPIVTMEKLTNSYTDQPDNIRKKRNIELMFLDHVQDAGNFNDINSIWNNMEWIAEDFLRKIKEDRRDKNTYPFLQKLRLNSAELDLVENVSTHLWGVLLSFELDIPFSECIEVGRFR